jgi:hypothetical protein
MSLDLSSIVKDTIYSTLEITLSNEVKENNIFTCNQDCLNGKNIVSIQSTFTFDKLTTVITFIFPAYFASYTFNTMMMEESEPLLEIDDDIADALKEVTAQISGSLETAINANTDDSLGSCKFSAGEFKIELGDNYSDISNLVMLTFNSNDKDFEIFINFDEEIAPYVEELLSNEVKITEIAPLIEDEDETEENTLDNDNQPISDTEEDESNNQEKILDETKDTISDDNLENEIENTIDDEEPIDEELKKEKKLKKIIIIIAGLLVVVLISFASLFFMGSFDPPVIVKDKNITKPSPQDIILANIKNKHITYKEDMIDINKLNKRLAILTKYEILETDILNEYKKREKERLYKLKMKSLEEFATRNKEEKLFFKDLNKSVKNKNRFTKDINESSKITYINNDEVLSLIKIDALIYSKYSKIINIEKTKSTAISMCKDKFGKINVYIGPIYINTLINNIILKVGKRDAKLIRVKRKEFNKMCDI